MEAVVYGMITILWWMSSFTVFLPFFFILKYSKYLRNRWFSFFFTTCMKVYLQPKLEPIRKKAFQLLKDSLSQRHPSRPLKVLEIGIGNGANFQFYPGNVHLTALDMNESFDTYFSQNKKKYPNINYERTVISRAENMKDIEDNSMDVVISTYVLCSVTSLGDVISEVKRVLKPGGQFLFLEHVSHLNSDWSSTVQKCANPLWKIFFNGCVLTRHTDVEIKRAGFSDVIYEKIYPKTLWLFIRAQVYGIATK